MSYRLGVDVGGTFTDLLLIDEDSGKTFTAKVPSTPQDSSIGVLNGVARICEEPGGDPSAIRRVMHGTTVATNAVLEGKGARVAYVTSKGFADVLTLGRQEREHVYQLKQLETPPPVPRELCLEVSTRIGAGGELLLESSDAELRELRERLQALDVESVAVNLLFAFLAPEQEQRIAAALEGPWFLSLSSQVLPEVRRYARGLATWLNASVGP